MNAYDELAEEHSIDSDAHAVILPTVESLTIDGWVESFLRRGGRSVQMASSAKEYNARRVSDLRRTSEDHNTIHTFCRAVNVTAGVPVMVAVNAESGGVQRIEHLLPSLPSSQGAATLPDSVIADAFTAYARAARQMGISMFLGPVVDMVTGTNAWLDGRMMIDDFTRTAAVGARYVEVVQAAGIIATAKHFPGHPDLAGHPGREVVELTIGPDEVADNLAPFVRLVKSGVQAVMLGPVTVRAIDPESPAATSKVLVDLLRREIGFDGLIVSDDLDLPSTMGRNSLTEIAVASVRAGVQLLLIPGGDSVAEVAAALTRSVEQGALSRSQLARAADTVRQCARSTAIGADDLDAPLQRA